MSTTFNPSLITSQASFTRPNDTTTYASGDLVADSTTAGSVHPLQFTFPTANFKIQRVGLVLSGAVNTLGSFRLHFYSNGPTVANGDNAAWSTTESIYMGDVDIDCTLRTFTDHAQGFGLFATSDVPLYLVINPATLLVYGLLEARAAFVPIANETFTVTLYGETF